MNIFYLHSDPSTAAHAMTDKHIIKMILESAQLLSTAHHVLDGDNSPFKDQLYKATHINHPSAKWVRESDLHYKWLYNHFVALSIEYTDRYGKTHKTYSELNNVLSHLPINIPHNGFVEPPCAMPDQYIVPNDSVRSYRRYYRGEKVGRMMDLRRFQSYFCEE